MKKTGSIDLYSGNIRRQAPSGMDVLLKDFIRSMHLAPGLNTQRIFDAWDTASGAAMHTTGRYFRSGTLFCTISSSMVRSQLSFDKDIILRKLNEILLEDDLYTPTILKDGSVRPPVEKIILK